ncbi:MAG: phosphomannose isomerase type II C-terminal cupin domain [Syntrophales bacterium]|nr:phosphomannose isomerase type II C-terminal cupin domain [Syntrophales bacterium]
MKEQRPWGDYEVLSEGPGHKVKRIVVESGKRLSLQRHGNRAEHWYMLSGEAIVTIDREDQRLKSGQSVDIPRETLHRMKNPGKEPVMFIEIQTGDYFGEDDIERLEDDFGRM